MATYTITTSAREEKALDFMLAQHNAERARADAEAREADPTAPLRPPLTKEQYVDNVLVRRTLLGYLSAMDQAEQAAVLNAFKAAPNAKQNEIKAALGL